MVGLVVAFLACMAGPASAAQPKLHALVIGINDYPALAEREQLKGAANDVALVKAALEAAGATSIVTLVNREATLAAVRTNLKQLSARASSGDWILVHFSGHGAQFPALDPSTEEEAGQKLDEVFATMEFEKSGKRGVLRDDEIHAWLKSVPRDVQVMFIADACHSGTGTRGKKNSFDDRFVPRSREIKVDIAPAASSSGKAEAPPVIRKVQDVQLPNVVYVPATIDEKEVKEVLADGQVHGALSVAVARAFKGYADKASNGDGRTTLKEFDRFLRMETARLSAEAGERQQTSNAKFVPGREAEVVPFLGKPGKLPAFAAKVQEVRLLVEGGRSRFNRPAPGVTLVQRYDDAEIVWNASTGKVSLAKGDSKLLAEGVRVRANEADTGVLPGGLLGAIGKRRALTVLSDIVARRQLLVQICKGEDEGKVCATSRFPGDLLEGDVVKITVDAQRGNAKHFLAFNLAPNGDLQLQQNFGGENFEMQVSPPFGRDDLVVVASSEKLDVLKKRLVSLACGNEMQKPCNSSGPVSEKVAAELADFISGAGKQTDIRVGHLIVYTQDKK
jgi:hypothetical protein